MGFQPIDINTWSRKEYYNHYINQVVCSYALTVQVDVTKLQNQKLYPAMLWLLTDTVNAYEQFRTHLSPQGLGIFDSMNPSYTIFNREQHNFSAIWTEFTPDYGEFLSRYRADTEKYKHATVLSPKPGAPDNMFDVSMVPWLNFSSFNLNIYGEGKYLLPIFTMGKTFDQEGKTWLPLAIQVHHAVCDGYHVSRFVSTLQQKIQDFSF